MSDNSLVYQEEREQAMQRAAEESQAAAEIERLKADRDTLRRLLALLYDRYENGPTVMEIDEGEIIEGTSLGHAVSLSSGEDAEILAALKESDHE